MHELELTDKKTGKVIAKVSAADPNTVMCDEGIWLEMKSDDNTAPMLCMIKDKPSGPFKGGWYLGVFRDAKQMKACDFAISFLKDEGPMLQVMKGNDMKHVNLFDMIAAIEKCCDNKQQVECR